MEAPVGCQSALTPGKDGGNRTCQNQEPCDDVEKSVRQDVHLQPGYCVDRIFMHVTHHVMPLQDLVKNDAVNKTAKA